jgi:hypothetical protein
MSALRSKSLHLIIVVLCLLSFGASQLAADENGTPVYVILWFDTEDYILPASDDATLRLARFLTRELIRAVFKIVGERALSFERRGRTDVIEALKKHEIGFHGRWHSVQPTPAQYLSDLGWDDGVAEFDRREKPGFDDVKRIFGSAPTCYGQPGSSWGPQSYGAMRQWGMNVYLDAGNHVRLADKPFYYGDVLNLYKLEHVLRARLDSLPALKNAEDDFLAARKKLHGEGGGIISIYYHPCEFVHKEFWDGVNFKYGANPPREQWRQPPMKSPRESQLAFEVFENYVRFMKRFPDVKFVTATQAAEIYRDRARGKAFTRKELDAIAAAVTDQVTFQRHGDYTLAPSEVFSLLNEYFAEATAGRSLEKITLTGTPYGPSNAVPVVTEPVTADWSQVTRTAADVADFVRKQKRIPTSVWLGSKAVPPESYLAALAKTIAKLEYEKSQEAPRSVTFLPARLAAADHVAADNPKLWGWVIFPRGFRAPAMMELAKRQAWTLKPAVLGQSSKAEARGGTP